MAAGTCAELKDPGGDVKSMGSYSGVTTSGSETCSENSCALSIAIFDASAAATIALLEG